MECVKYGCANPAGVTWRGRQRLMCDRCDAEWFPRFTVARWLRSFHRVYLRRAQLLATYTPPIAAGHAHNINLDWRRLAVRIVWKGRNA